MDVALDIKQVSPPATYEDWLNCFDLLKLGSSVDGEVVNTIASGSFGGSGYITGQFQQKLAETINVMLNNRIARFLKDLNLLISFNELIDIVPLFIKLRNEVNKCLFFTGLDFLDNGIKSELEESVKSQMGKFWNDTIKFLQEQTMEFYNADLEDSLFLLRRIELFSKTA